MSRPSWFSAALLPWYDANRRDLPWRRTTDPYAVWLSEVILQQTRVDQGMAYWLRFMERFPTVELLAAAQEDEVLRLWQGLGYYSRARNLLATARLVLERHQGYFPVRYDDLLTLPGVGPYTAAAIASISHGARHAVVDGNVYRVLSRVFGVATPINSPAGGKEFATLANILIDPTRPGDHNQAVMELGATVCLPRRPECDACPLAGRCVARSEGREEELPVKIGRTAIRHRHFNHLHIPAGDGLFLEKRVGRDIWHGLFQLPLIETEKPLGKAGLLTRLAGIHVGNWRIAERSGPFNHPLTHQRLRIVFWRLDPPSGFLPPGSWRAVKTGDLGRHALPRPIDRYMHGTLR